MTLQSYSQADSDDIRSFAEEQVAAFAEDYPGVSVSVSHRGRIVWNTTHGYRDLERQLPVEPTTKFNIYSTSKFITGLAFLKLVHSGQLESLDVRVRDLDPTLPITYDAMTLRHLLTHTSGIRHYNGKQDWKRFADLRCASPAEAVAYFANDPLKAPPGQEEIYTTYGMVLASHLLEKITGLDYLAALNQLLPFRTPLELDSETAEKAVPYRRKGKNYRVYPGLSAECKYGGGGLIASSDQLAQAGQFFYDSSVVPLEELKQLLQADWPTGATSGVSFAIGSGISESVGLHANQGGASPGGRSYLLVLAEQEVAVAITTNCEGDGEKSYELALALAKRFAGI